MQMKKASSLLKILGIFLVGLVLQPPLVGADPFNDPQPDPIVEDDIGTTSHCRSHLKIYDDCKDRNDRDHIKVWTRNCSPYRRDWIGLHEDTGRKEVGRNRGPHYWKYTDDWKFVCGSQEIDYCSAWYKKYNWFDEWPDKLSTGTYKFYLFSNDGYYVKAESASFRVETKNECDATYSPTESPTPAPTRCRNRGGSFQLRWRSRWRNCSWARRWNTSYRCTWRIKYPFRGTVADVCPVVCGVCRKPTRNPTRSPTPSPTESPTPSPTESPTPNPTESRDPTLSPTDSSAPSDTPSISLFPSESNYPSVSPTN